MERVSGFTRHVRPVHMLKVHKRKISESKLPGKAPADLGIPPVEIKNITESSLLTLQILSLRIGCRGACLRLQRCESGWRFEAGCF